MDFPTFIVKSGVGRSINLGGMGMCEPYDWMFGSGEAVL
jgi:hypothetical protein